MRSSLEKRVQTLEEGAEPGEDAAIPYFGKLMLIGEKRLALRAWRAAREGEEVPANCAGAARLAEELQELVRARVAEFRAFSDDDIKARECGLRAFLEQNQNATVEERVAFFLAQDPESEELIA